MRYHRKSLGKRKKLRMAKVFLYVVVVALAIFCALPLVYLISTAFKPLNELYRFPPRFFVQYPTWKNFKDLFLSLSSSTVPFSRYFLNSAFVTTVTVAATVLVCSLGAFSLVKYRPPGGKAFFGIVLGALMFSPYVTQIPRYLVINSLQLNDSYWALILPNIAVAYNFFLMKQFVEQFPNELLEAARIDGSGEFKLFFKIVLPYLTPARTTLVVFSFVSNWNDYFSPLIYLRDSAKITLPLALNTISGGTSSIGRAGAVAAATTIMALPPVIIFTLMQRKVMETMVYSGIKG